MRFTFALVASISCLLASHVCGDDHRHHHHQNRLRQRRRRRTAVDDHSSRPLSNYSTTLISPFDIGNLNEIPHEFGPVVFDYQRQERRLDVGGYLVLLKDSVENKDVKSLSNGGKQEEGRSSTRDTAAYCNQLAKEQGLKPPSRIMTATIHGCYFSAVSDAKVKSIQNDPGVEEVDPNYIVTMFSSTGSTGSSSRSHPPKKITTNSDTQEEDGIFTTKALTEQQKKRRRKRRRRRKRQQERNRNGGGGGRPNKPNLQPVPWNIERVGGPQAYKGSAKVFVIDTGIDYNNKDLNVHLKFAKNFLNPNKSAQDDHGHGTYCAGIIGALDNEFGVVGVRPGVRVVPLKALDNEGTGDFAAIIDAVDWVARHGKKGDVCNMSLGGGSYSPLDNAVRAAADKGIIFVLASGNEGQDAKNVSPARLNHPNVITVSAMDNKDTWASFSNFGSPVDVASPGQYIQSLVVGGGISGFIQGTSFAAPHVAALKLGDTFVDGRVKDDPDGKADKILKYKKKN